mmetsp:Transcript_1812/g.2217  ORF Transcript_1812/g.2217 Transcript_1812/m.2217 type:complete len:266 (+) Transcript_1812:955-1752(+)
MQVGFDEIRSEITVIADQISAKNRINAAWSLMDKQAREVFVDSIIEYKYGEVFASSVDQKLASDAALDNLYQALIDAKAAIGFLLCDGDVLAQCKLSCSDKSSSCSVVDAGDNSVIDDQYLYTVRFGWHSIFIICYFQYMEIVQEYLLLAAYSLSKGYHNYIIQYNDDVQNGLNPVNCLENGLVSLLSRGEADCEWLNLLPQKFPDKEEFDYVLSMLEDGYNHVMTALDNDHNFEHVTGFDDYCSIATNGANGGTSYLWYGDRVP